MEIKNILNVSWYFAHQLAHQAACTELTHHIYLLDANKFLGLNFADSGGMPDRMCTLTGVASAISWVSLSGSVVTLLTCRIWIVRFSQLHLLLPVVVSVQWWWTHSIWLSFFWLFWRCFYTIWSYTGAKTICRRCWSCFFKVVTCLFHYRFWKHNNNLQLVILANICFKGCI